jgi:beta-phosphoglucomutase
MPGAAGSCDVSASPRPLAGVLFDLDGVIVDTARLHYAAWKRLADSLSLHFDEGLNQALKGIDRLGSLDLLLGPQAQHVTPAEKQRLADLKNRWYVQSLISIGAGDLLPGAYEALDQVRRAGLRMALVSASRNATVVLDRMGIADQFDSIVELSGISRGKPAPDIFLAAARDLDVKPDGCLGIEDAAAGVAGLKAAGMAVIGVGDPLVLHQADWVIPDLTHFRLSAYRSVA